MIYTVTSGNNQGDCSNDKSNEEMIKKISVKFHQKLVIKVDSKTSNMGFD